MTYLFLGIFGLVIGTLSFYLVGRAAIYLGLLTGLLGLPAASAASTSLVTVLPSLIVGAWTYYRQGKVKVKLGNQMLITAVPAVVIGSLVSKLIPDHLYKWIIGIVLIILGLNMLFQKSQASGPSNKLSRSIQIKAGLFGIVGGLMVGVAGMSGGAPIIAGLFLMGLPTINAAATSAYVLVFMSAIGTIFHIAGGQVDWSVGISLMIGSLVGAAIAPTLLNKLTQTKAGNYLKPLIAIFLAALGLKTLF
ncbi:hypothetical protein JCM14202_3675 [Agrilactobacillus composti DSM 18527 = JCM 14202]|uniref:sulfite exporter TauE/SafE family protein n=1 Tax=Agrilactobacillus composti TaxID=398555 RepID=UPI00042DE881|nr:sulfite exporter TauE/SafE family protein [Agrilactobacillus composti]GAF41720.1 hypothetical protein JCM14202_3675 [Agrilactobacillus composti DSM 18527 = JCM 14202]